MALCPYFGQCGGCQTQHLEYEVQLTNKQRFVTDKLRKEGIEHPPPRIIPSNPYHYRNRMDFIFTPEGPGMRRQGRWDRMITTRTCPISNARINTLLAEVWTWLEKNTSELDIFDVRAKQGTLRYAVIRCTEYTDSSSITFILNTNSTKITKHQELIQTFSKTTTAQNILIGLVPRDTDQSVTSDCYTIKGDVYLTETLHGKNLRYHSQAFFQNNSAMAQAMIKHAEHLLNDAGGTLLDLYGGVGTFGICLAEHFQHALIIENSAESIKAAQHNIASNNLHNTTAHLTTRPHSPQKTSHQTSKPNPSPSSPTRHAAACSPKTTSKPCLRLKPQRILYISCNPAQMAKELRHLRNYNITDLALFDLFPQTNHIEAMALLERQRSHTPFA
ncbi:MAG: 23S rRNA (uracil(1939)-C(5))-methyltransferase RlmD [Nitrosarchaeum sp.]|nr:23S rRNA (uracil(1939)-C(5))-methyltransferase RlmD [Nitrosarchaeum sp.]